MRILGVGIATLDIINRVDHYPLEDEELRANSQHICRGGNTANSLSVLSQFGHNCYWVGTLANDINAQTVLDDFSRNNINTSFCKNLKTGKQPCSYITLNKKNGSRTIVHYRDLPELDFEYFEALFTQGSLNNFDWIHFEARAIEETEKMIQLVKTHYPDTNISIEIEKPRVNLNNIFDLANVYIFSKSYANHLGFENPENFLTSQKQYSPNANLVCSWGKQGAFALLKNGEFISSKSFPPKEIVDTIGAGDTFNAALIHSRLKSEDWKTSLQFACEIAGKKCGQLGYENLV